MFQMQQINQSPGEILAEASPRSSDSNKTSKPLFLLFCYLYFAQGAIMGIVGTMPYVYTSLPDVPTMAIFNLVSLPYSLKFLIAPFLQKFSNVHYGKRKGWIVISQVLTGLLLLVSCSYTGPQQAAVFAALSLAMMTGMVLQNIALHSLIVKEIASAEESSMIQSFAQVFGILVGGLILLKLTSRDFALKVGLSEPIALPATVLLCFSGVLIGPLTAIHLRFKQRILESELRGKEFSLCKIVCHYRVFLSPATSYFRFCLFALVFNQGINFFNSLYDYELVKAGFSRDTSNTISNIIILPIIFLTFYFKAWTAKLGGHYHALLWSMLVTISLYAYILMVFPLEPWKVGLLGFLIGLMEGWRFFVFGVIINQFPLHGLSGMYITLLGSFFNFGRLTPLHTWLCGAYGWRQMSAAGLVLQLVLLLGSRQMYNWLQAGQSSIPSQLRSPKEDGTEPASAQSSVLAAQ